MNESENRIRDFPQKKDKPVGGDCARPGDDCPCQDDKDVNIYGKMQYFSYASHKVAGDHLTRLPNNDVPIRTIVAPSSTATS